jgi:aminoglycoside phosphotransferase (APT) family kinase protein
LLNVLDTKKEIAIDILKNELNIMPIEVIRFPTGFCHSVYYVKTKTEVYVLRITESKWHYDGSVKWLNKLAKFEIPIPKILKNGQYRGIYYTLITYINGKDIGDVYYMLNDFQKRDIVKGLVEIQRKVSVIPADEIENSDYYSSAVCIERIQDVIQRHRDDITKNNIFDPNYCDVVLNLANKFNDYFASVKPMAYLDDISDKNVLIHDGKLAGIVDIDEMGYGDPLEIIGLTNLALLLRKADTKYVDYWLDEMQVNDTQKKALAFYTLLFCIGIMGERGMKFDNDTVVPVKQNEVDLLNSIFNKLLTTL